jgi:chromate reductase, NAD(P)H dehydrogenase (quinone)
MSTTTSDVEPRNVSFLVLSGSGRMDSLNTKMARLAAAVIESEGGRVDFATMADFVLPAYNGDDEDADGIPDGADQLRARIEATDAFLIASPEYNGSMPGCVKNAIDWVSRFRPQPFSGRHALLVSASPSMVGGNRGLWALRVPLEHLGAHVFANMFSLAQAHESLDDDGQIMSESLQHRFHETIAAFIDLVEAAVGGVPGGASESGDGSSGVVARSARIDCSRCRRWKSRSAPKPLMHGNHVAAKR